MAETLRWPKSLNKQIRRIENNCTRKTGFCRSFPILFIGLILCAAMQLYFRNTELTSVFLLSWSFIMAIIIFDQKLFNSNIESEKLLKGLGGEILVANILDGLPEGWFIINDIILNRAQIDHICIGPTGIFCIETKNWNNAGCDKEGFWYRFHLGHWVPIKTNPAEQNAVHVSALKKCIKKLLGIDKKVYSIIVMANSKAKLNIMAKIIPPEDTIICLPDELHHYILNTKETELTPNEAHIIAGALINNFTL